MPILALPTFCIGIGRAAAARSGPSMATVQLVANLAWSGNHGFDPEGRRVAAVARDFYYGPPIVQGGGHGLFWSRRHWLAFVAYDGHFDYVLVDGELGHWRKNDEAKAAAESAYRSWVRKSSNNTASVAGEDGTTGGSRHSEAAPGPEHTP
jgi:hypothetical protein